MDNAAALNYIRYTKHESYNTKYTFPGPVVIKTYSCRQTKDCQINKPSLLSSKRSDEMQLTCSPPSKGRKNLSGETCHRPHRTASLKAFLTTCQVRIKQSRTIDTWGSLTLANNSPSYTKPQEKQTSLVLVSSEHRTLFFFFLIIKSWWTSLNPDSRDN